MTKASFFGGLAIFAMFFGSGNLIFPLLIGKETTHLWSLATIGLAVSGVFLPMFGLIAMLYTRKDMEQFFGGLFNKFGSKLASLVVLLLCGPFGVAPRCVTVAEGAWHSVFPGTPAIVFVTVCCLVVWGLIYFDTNIIDLIGKVFTPFKLAGLLTIIFSSIYVALKTHHPIPEKVATTGSPIMVGLLNGYGTMDLFGALFLGPTIVAYFKKPNMTEKKVNSECVKAILLGFSIILFIYTCLIFLGATYSADIQNATPTELLPKIVNSALGTYSLYIISFTLIVATMVTAIALISVTVDYITPRMKALKNSRVTALNVCMILTFLFSAMGFSSIMAFLTPLLQAMYPLTIFILLIHMYAAFKKKEVH